MEHEVLRKLSKDQSIFVVKSAKTKQVVIMNKNNYIEKSMTRLGDTKKCKKLDNDPTITREKQTQCYSTENEKKKVK